MIEYYIYINIGWCLFTIFLMRVICFIQIVPRHLRKIIIPKHPRQTV